LAQKIIVKKVVQNLPKALKGRKVSLNARLSLHQIITTKKSGSKVVPNGSKVVPNGSKWFFRVSVWFHVFLMWFHAFLFNGSGNRNVSNVI
jgi:hypothetical protein